MTDFDFSDIKMKMTANDMDDLNDLDKGSDGQYEEVPYGQYEVRVTKIELVKTKPTAKNPNQPMARISFRVINNENISGYISYFAILDNKYITMRMQMTNRLLKSMKTNVDLSPSNFRDAEGNYDLNAYRDLLTKVYEDITSRGLEYGLDYSENDKGFATYTITNVFDKPMA